MQTYLYSLKERELYHVVTFEKENGAIYTCVIADLSCEPVMSFEVEAGDVSYEHNLTIGWLLSWKLVGEFYQAKDAGHDQYRIIYYNLPDDKPAIHVERWTDKKYYHRIYDGSQKRFEWLRSKHLIAWHVTK